MHEIRYSNTNVYKFQIFRTDFLVSIVSMNFCVFIEKQFPDWTQTGAAAREASAPEASGGRDQRLCSSGRQIRNTGGGAERPRPAREETENWIRNIEVGRPIDGTCCLLAVAQHKLEH